MERARECNIGSQGVNGDFSPSHSPHSDIIFFVEAPAPVRYGTDSYGNKVGYLEINAPQEKQITLRETFTLTRT